MSNPYLKLFQPSGTTAFATAGLVARFPLSMGAIGIITMLSQTHGSYSLAGSVGATFTLANALFAPQISRMVDRYGQSSVLPYVTLCNALAMLALLACTRYHAPDWALYIFSAMAGSMPSMSAMSRARWTEFFRNTPQLHTAYSLESVLDEICFIVGPPLAIGLSVAAFPEAGPLASTLLLVIGVSCFVLQKKTEPPIHPSTGTQKGSVIRLGSIQILTLTLVGLGAIPGSIDVISIAFAEQSGQPAAASIVISLYAVGSCISGVYFGTKELSIPLPRLLIYSSLATALATLPLLLVSNLWILSGVAFVAGLCFAPTVIIAIGLVEKIVPSTKLTEGLTWTCAGLGLGVALGASLAGWVVEQSGVQAGFTVSLAAGVAVLVLPVLGYRLLAKYAMTVDKTN